MIETKDLILRQGKDGDWADLYQNLWYHESVFRFMFSKASPSAEAARKKAAAFVQMHKEVPTEFFVIEKSSGQAIGITGLKEMEPGSFAVTDIAIGPDFTGRGYGKQILTALICLAFEECGAEQLLYCCFAENEVSKHLALSCGFFYSHSEKAELKKNGEVVILECYKRCK